MDIFSHGLWTGAIYKGINKKVKRPFKVKLAVFWDVFPDIFAFSMMFFWSLGNFILGNLDLSKLPPPHKVEPAAQNTLPIFNLTSLLYSLSHSVIIFIIVFALTSLIFRRPIWEMGGWLVHILLDIPTHSYQFYPTPFLWPISNLKFNGFSWATPWFLIVNYLAIIIVYFLLNKKKISKFTKIKNKID